MNPRIIAVGLVCVSLIFYALGEYYSKVWSLRPIWNSSAAWCMAVIVVFCYALSGVAWLPALREHGQLSALSAVWSCLSIMVCVAIGTIIFKEELTARQIIGLILALLASILTF